MGGHGRNLPGGGVREGLRLRSCAWAADKQGGAITVLGLRAAWVRVHAGQWMWGAASGQRLISLMRRANEPQLVGASARWQWNAGRPLTGGACNLFLLVGGWGQGPWCGCPGRPRPSACVQSVQPAPKWKGACAAGVQVCIAGEALGRQGLSGADSCTRLGQAEGRAVGANQQAEGQLNVGVCAGGGVRARAWWGVDLKCIPCTCIDRSALRSMQHQTHTVPGRRAGPCWGSAHAISGAAAGGAFARDAPGRLGGAAASGPSTASGAAGAGGR